MKRILSTIILLCILSLAFSVSVFAKRIDTSYFSVNVPKGWVYEVHPSGYSIDISKDGGGARILLGIGPRVDIHTQDAEYFAQVQSKGMDGSAVVKDADGFYYFTFIDKGKKHHFYCKDLGDKMFIKWIRGPKELWQPIIDSIKIKRLDDLTKKEQAAKAE